MKKIILSSDISNSESDHCVPGWSNVDQCVPSDSESDSDQEHDEGKNRTIFHPGKNSKIKSSNSELLQDTTKSLSSHSRNELSLRTKRARAIFKLKEQNKVLEKKLEKNMTMSR